MAKPDVRVRLSAEGVKEVVDAFQKIQTEAKKTGSAGSSAAKGLGELDKLLPRLTFAAAVAGMTAMIKRSLDLADAAGKLSQKTGLSVETISTLSFAARTADLSQEQLRTGLIKFAKAMDDVDRGAQETKDSVRQLFGNQNALKGLGEDARLKKVLDQLAKLGPGAKRTGLAIQFFGKAGAELIPLLDDLADGGFAKLEAKAQRLGLQLNGKLTAGAQRANDAMTDMKSAAEGAALQLTVGLAPALESVSEAALDATTSNGVDGFKEVGHIAGQVIRGIAAAFLIVGSTIGFVLEEGEQLWHHFKDAAIDDIKGIFHELREISKSTAGKILLAPLGLGGLSALPDIQGTKPGENHFLDRLNAFRDNLKRQLDALFTDQAGSPLRKGGGSDRSTDLENAEREAKARLALEKALLDNALSIIKANLKLREDAEKAAFEQGLESIADYYAKRRQIIQEGADAESASLREQIQALQAQPLQKGETQADREKAIQDLRTKLVLRQIQLQGDLANLNAEERKAQEDNNSKALQFESKLKQTQADRHAAAIAQLQLEAKELDEILAKAGVSLPERQRQVGSFTESGTAGINFDEKRAEAQAQLNELTRQQQQIQLQVASGKLFEFEGEQKILEIERARLPLLQQLAAAMLAQAQASGDPARIQQAQEFNDQIQQLGVNADRAGQQMANFKANVQSAIQQDIFSFLTRGIDEAESFGDAMRGLALSVVDSLRQIAAQMLSTLITAKLLAGLQNAAKFFGFSGGGAVPGGAGGHADGGVITGPGTGTSDSIPAWLSAGEYVMRAAAVRREGVKELLDNINYGNFRPRRLRARGYADGGLVQGPAGAGAGGRALLDIALDDALLIKRLERHPEFGRIVMNVAERQPKRFNTALGRRS